MGIICMITFTAQSVEQFQIKVCSRSE